MGIKKQLGLGMATAALGLSLVGGGTFAYFNDVDTINNKLANGTLDLAIKPGEGTQAINFDLSNLKPGDSVTRRFKLDADGSLAIKKVLMDLNASPADFRDQLGTQTGDANAMKDFLNQFEVTVLKGQIAPDPNSSSPNSSIFTTSANMIAQSTTLLDLWEANPANGSGVLSSKISVPFYDTTSDAINLTPTGLPVDPDDVDGVEITITFKDNGNQNRFQGDSAKFQFVLTATQEAGTSVPQNVGNGYLEGNEHSGSANTVTGPGAETSVVPGTDVPNDN
jgi:spore coat-associated protein N